MSCAIPVRYQGRHRGDPPGCEAARLARTSGLVLTGGLVLAASAPASAHMPQPDDTDWASTVPAPVEARSAIGSGSVSGSSGDSSRDSEGSSRGESARDSVVLRAVIEAEARRNDRAGVVGPWSASCPGAQSREPVARQAENEDRGVESRSTQSQSRRTETRSDVTRDGEGQGHKSGGVESRGDENRNDPGPERTTGPTTGAETAMNAESGPGATQAGEGRPRVTTPPVTTEWGDGRVPVAPAPSKRPNTTPEPSAAPEHVTAAPDKRAPAQAEQGRAERDTAGKDTAGKDAAGKDAGGKDTAGKDSTGKAAAGRDSQEKKAAGAQQPDRTKKAQQATRESAPKTTTEGSRRDVVGIAAGLKGIPYVWGGTSTKGFDCSGFTQHVFKKAGVDLPRTAAQQQRATKKVSDPKPGDLVFFGSPAYHVGVYAGDGKMYDAPRRGKTTGLRTIWSSKVSYGRAA